MRYVCGKIDASKAGPRGGRPQACRDLALGPCFSIFIVYSAPCCRIRSMHVLLTEREQEVDEKRGSVCRRRVRTWLVAFMMHGGVGERSQQV